MNQSSVRVMYVCIKRHFFKLTANECMYEHSAEENALKFEFPNERVPYNIQLVLS